MIVDLVDGRGVSLAFSNSISSEVAQRHVGEWRFLLKDFGEFRWDPKQGVKMVFAYFFFFFK